MVAVALFMAGFYASGADQTDPDARKRVQSKIGELLRTIKDEQQPWRVRRAAIYGLRDKALAPGVESAVPTLVELLGDPNLSLRITASRALSGLGEVSIGPLNEAVEDPMKMAGAVESLYWMGAKGVPALTQLLAHDRTPVRREVAKLLSSARRGYPPTVSALTQALTDKSPEVRAYAAKALGKVRGASASAVPVLIKNLGDAEPEPKLAGIRALGSIGEPALPAKSQLTTILVNRKVTTDTRAAAAEALAQMGAKPIEPLGRILEDTTEARTLRIAASKALGAMGAGAAPALLGVLTDTDEQIRWNAAVALSRLPDAASVVAGGLADASALRRRYAAFALGRMALRARTSRRRSKTDFATVCDAAAPALVSALRDRAAEVRRNAAAALGEMPEKAEQTIPALKSLLRDAEPSVRLAAVQALGKIGAPATSVKEELEKILRSAKDRKLQWVAAYALEGIEGARPEAGTAETVAIRGWVLNKFVRMFDGQWQGMILASDGNCYFGGGGHWADHGSAFFQFRPQGQKLEMLCDDITTICGEDLAQTPPQGKIHSQVVEHKGWVFFGTHLADYSTEGCRTYTGAHLVGYELASRKFRDYGVIHPNYTNYSGLGVDPVRDQVYLWLTPFAEGDGSYLYRVDIATGKKESIGPLKRTSCQYLFVDSRGDCWFQIGELCRFRAATGELDCWPDTIPNRKWERRLVLPGGDRCFVPSGDTLYILDANEERDSPGAFVPVKRIGATHHGLAMNKNRLYFTRSQRRPRKKGEPRRRDTWLMSLSLDPAARPGVVNHGLMTDQDGRTPHGIWSMEVDNRDRLYMTGRWYVLPGEEKTIGVNRGDGFICLQFDFVDMSKLGGNER